MADRRLTMEEANHLRARHARGELNVRQAADAYGLGIESVRRILRYETYRQPGKDEYGRLRVVPPNMEEAAAESAKRFLEMQATQAPQAAKPEMSALDIYMAAAAKAREDAKAGDDFVESLVKQPSGQSPLVNPEGTSPSPKPGGDPADGSEF